MAIRQATEADIPEVKKIITSLQISREQKEWEKARWGFFEYTKNEQELAAALNPYFIVAQTPAGIRGFCLAYDNKFFKKYCGEIRALSWEFLLEGVKGKFLYVDQLGVSNPETIGAGKIARDLANCEIDRAKQEGLERIVEFVCEKPFLNARSSNFIEKMGGKRAGVLTTGRGISLGVYFIEL